MTIDYREILTRVRRQLSLVGKRLTNKEGANLFSGVTPSTAEEATLEEWIQSGLQNVVSVLRDVVTNWGPTLGGAGLVLTNTRGTPDFDARCRELVLTYVTLYTVCEYLGVVDAGLGERYRSETNDALLSLQLYALHKEAPSRSSLGYGDVTGEVV